MDYHLNPAILGEIIALPAAVVDENIRLAKVESLKVLLWLLRNGKGTFDSAACARATGMTSEQCADGFNYWFEREIFVTADKNNETTVRAKQQLPAAASSAVASAGDISIDVSARPKLVKPQYKEVITKKSSSDAFSYLMDTVSARLGKPLSPGDSATLLYLYETAGLPVEVILLIVGYTVSHGKSNMRYIESVALDWADHGFDTIIAAEQHLCDLERCEEAWLKLSMMLDIKKSPTSAERDIAARWILDWHLDDELIKLSHRLCINATEKLSLRYMDKILGRWRSDGIDTVEKAEKTIGNGKAEGGKSRSKKSPTGKKEVGQPSFDLSEYSERVKDFKPVYVKKI